MDPSRLDLSGDRGLWFVSDPLVFVDDDFTGATFRMQVRQTPDASGTPLADLATVTSAIEGIELTYAGTDTVTNHITAGRLTSDDATSLGYAGTDSVTLSILVIRISAATMGTMPAASDIGDDLDLAHDLLITLPSDFEQKRFYGTFTVRGTVTQ